MSIAQSVPFSSCHLSNKKPLSGVETEKLPYLSDGSGRTSAHIAQTSGQTNRYYNKSASGTYIYRIILGNLQTEDILNLKVLSILTYSARSNTLAFLYPAIKSQKRERKINERSLWMIFVGPSLD